MARSGQRWGTLALLLVAGVIGLVVPSIPAYAAGGCATPGRDGTASLSGVINTYYPGVGTAAGGGAGANTWPAQAGAAGVNYHGPGGGGGGGVVLTTSAPTAVSVVGGANGTTTTDW